MITIETAQAPGPIYKEDPHYHKGYAAGFLEAQREKLGAIAQADRHAIRAEIHKLSEKFDNFYEFIPLLRALDKDLARLKKGMNILQQAEIARRKCRKKHRKRHK